MTIDIIEAAKADRQTTENLLAIARDQLTELSEYVLRLQLDLIEQDSHIKWAMDILERFGNHPESTTPETTETGPVEPETPEEATTHSEPEIPTIPQPQEGEETVTVADQAPVKTEPSQYDKVVAVLRTNRDATIREICELAGVPRGTASVYRGKALAELYPHKAPRKPGPVQEPVAAPFQTTTRNIPIGPSTRPSGKTKFRLRNAEGLYLHSDLNAMLRKGLRFVSKRDYPWTGTEQQMLAVRKMLPATIDLKEEVIQP